MTYSWMKAVEKRRTEADSGDTGMDCCLVRERLQWAMGIGVDMVGLEEGFTLGYHRSAAVGGGGDMGDAAGACVGGTLGEGLGAVVVGTLGECVGDGGGGTRGHGVGRAGASGTAWVGKMGMCAN